MNSINFKGSRQRGFTLIELMIVVAIIGILAAIAIPKFADMVKKSQEGRTRGNLAATRSALSIYYGDNDGAYPIDDLSSMVPKYLKAIADSQVPAFSGFAGHAKTTTVTVADEFVTSTATEVCEWGFVNNADSTNWGQFWVYCTHND